jgi:signal transduction histidine kinase
MIKTNRILFAIWLVIAAFTGYLITVVVNSRQSIEQRMRDQALSDARLVEEHAAAVFDRANSALIEISDHLRPSDLTGAGPLPDARRREIEELLISHQQRTAGIIATFLTRADGRIAAISLRAPPGTDLSDRTYFQTLKRERRSSPVVSEVVYARVSKTWGAMVARRIDLPDGSFGGMLGANMGLNESFSNFYSTLSLGNNSTVSLRDPENRLLVRYPITENKLGRQLSTGGPINERLAAGDSEGVVVATSSVDNEERVFGFRKLANYPIYAIVGLSLEEGLSVWTQNRNNAVVAALLVILAGGFITDALRRKERAEEELRDLNETLEARVRERSDELSSANRRLEAEVAERKRAEASAVDHADRLKRFIHRTVNVLEEEQRRLARELHDRVSSNLTAISLNLENIEDQMSREELTRFGNALSDCAGLVADSVASARDICSDLHPAILDYMGLVPALKDLGEKFHQRTSIPVGVSGTNVGQRLPPDREIALFRISQEALLNCAKHSKARMVAIQLDQDPKRIELTIKDDGAGFGVDQLGAPGLGLLSMKERAQAVGGSCRIDSAPGEGTRVIVELALS